MDANKVEAIGKQILFFGLWAVTLVQIACAPASPKATYKIAPDSDAQVSNNDRQTVDLPDFDQREDEAGEAPNAPAQLQAQSAPERQAQNPSSSAAKSAPAAPKASAATRKPVVPPVAAAHPALPQNKMPVPAWALKNESELWTRLTLQAINEVGQALVQTDIEDAKDYCPTYAKLTPDAREKVWVQLISSMAKFESRFNPIAAFPEKFRGRDNKWVISRGLLQISKDSANSYGCNIQKESELEDPETNLRCGVRILATLVSKYHAIHGLQGHDLPRATLNSILHNPWRGAARYWSVLRAKGKDLLIRSSVRQLSVCRG